MEKIFRVRPLPHSFRINKVRYPGVGFFPSLDGPRPVYYFATVSGTEYPALTANIAAKKTLFDHLYGHRMAAVTHFDPALTEAGLYQEGGLKELPDMFDVLTTTTAGYGRNTYVVADTRSSDSVALYVTTTLPYSE